MTIDKFTKVVNLLGVVLRSFSPGNFPAMTGNAIGLLIGELKDKKGSAAFVDSLIDLEQGIKEYQGKIRSFGRDIGKARDRFKEILIKFRMKLINERPYGSAKPMGELSRMVGMPWP